MSINYFPDNISQPFWRLFPLIPHVDISGSGLGRLLSHRFAKLGCELVLWDVNKEGNEQTAAQVKRLGVKVQAYEVDLSKREDVYKVADMVSAATAATPSV